MRVLKLLSDSRVSITTAQIARQLDLPQRTVQRILLAAEHAGFPIRRDEPGMGGGVRLVTGQSLNPVVPCDQLEAAALQIALALMREAAENTRIGEAFEHLGFRLLQQLNSSQRDRAKSFARLYHSRAASAPPNNASPIAVTVQCAIDQSKVLTIQYRSQNQPRAQPRDVEPLGVYTAPGRTYLVARDPKKNAVRNFAFDRILGATLTEASFAPDPTFEVARVFADSLGVFVGEPVDLELRLDPEAYRRLGGKRPHASAKTQVRPDGSATMRLRSPLSDELLAWMVTLGPGVSVLSPAAASAFVKSAFASRVAAQPRRSPKAGAVAGTSAIGSGPSVAPTSKPRRKKLPKPLQLPGPLLARMKQKAR